MTHEPKNPTARAILDRFDRILLDRGGYVPSQMRESLGYFAEAFEEHYGVDALKQRLAAAEAELALIKGMAQVAPVVTEAKAVVQRAFIDSTGTSAAPSNPPEASEPATSSTTSADRPGRARPGRA